MYSKTILEKIQNLPEGEPFKASLLIEIAPYASVRKALSTLVKSGYLMRVSWGVYVRPEISRYAGSVPPSSGKILKLVAEGEKVAITGAEAAQRLGLSTQMVLKEIYLTSGRTRTIRLENGGKIFLRHASQRKMVLAGRLAGVALSALWWMGKKEVTPKVISSLQEKLPPEEFQALKEAVPFMPMWMGEKFLLNGRKEPSRGRQVS